MRKLLLAAPLAAVVTTPLAGQAPVWDANLVRLERTVVAPGVHALVASGAAELGPKGTPLATTSGIVVGSKAALVVDTMINRRLASMVLGEVRKLTGGAPTYAVNTSYHGDHTYGNAFFPAATVVIQHAATQAFIAAHFEKDVQFMLGAFGKGRGIEAVRARAADILIPAGGALHLDLGGKRVEIVDFGFAQTGGDLWVWLPQERVLFTGNPVIAEAPAIPWLLDGHLEETLATMQRVRAFLPEGATIVPGHGRPVTVAALDWHIEYLVSLRDQVRAAIAQKATLEQTVGSVNVAKAQPYAIYGWVHKQINVPAAYRELSR